MLKIILINGAQFEVKSKDFAKGTTTTKIYRKGLRNLVMANWYIISATPI